MWARALPENVLVIDLDRKHGKNGVAEFERLQGCAVEQYLAPKVQTGTAGIHVYTDQMGQDYKNTRDVIAPGIDTRAEGGYVIIPSGDGLYHWLTSPDTALPAASAWAAPALRQATDHGPRAEARAFQGQSAFGNAILAKACAAIAAAAAGEQEDTLSLKSLIVGHFVGGGVLDKEPAIAALVAAGFQMKNFDTKNPWTPAGVEKKVKKCVERGMKDPRDGSELTRASLEDFYAYMPQHSYIYIPTREHWPASSIDGKFRKVGKVKASKWLDQNRAVNQMTWAPGEEMLIHNRVMTEGGWIEKEGIIFNLYRPAIVEPGDATRAGRWLEHVHRLFGEDAEHIVKWFAQRVQHPEVKINHALVLGSEKQGIGKDVMLEPVKRTIGPWNFGEVNPQQVLGRFNGFFKRVILRINEARDLGDTSRYQFYDHMKTYIASPPDVLRVDEKNTKEYSILNCVGIIITTNYKTTGIYLPAEDRRHYVAWSNLAPGDFSEGYWNSFCQWYEVEGFNHVAAYLREYDISAFDPKAPPPKTRAFWDIVDANRAPEDAELADALDALGNPEATTIRHVINHSPPAFAQWLQEKRNRREIPHRFEKCGYVQIRSPDRQDGLWRVCGVRQMIYVLSTLSCKDQIIAAKKLIQDEEGPDDLGL
ncbi:Bifunctional DNA primase/polymerase, N-terminal [Rhizobiales bacterium GAS191]|nr:Bifunctional DNA primase/polymerase, N-terminal [Rhizobiales bacterium GAS191]